MTHDMKNENDERQQNNTTIDISAIMKKAEAGDAEAQFILGRCYQIGDDIEDDKEKSAFWMEKSAENGYAEAQFYLGAYYEKGYGVETNLKTALLWYQKSAEQGYAIAKYYLEHSSMTKEVV